jgi:hypothetical protein
MSPRFQHLVGDVHRLGAQSVAEVLHLGDGHWSEAEILADSERYPKLSLEHLAVGCAHFNEAVAGWKLAGAL